MIAIGPERTAVDLPTDAERLSDHLPISVLAGAGASADAGVPVAYALFDHIIDSLIADPTVATLLKNRARPGADGRPFIRFETLLSWIVTLYDEDLNLLGFLDQYTEPGPIHRALVGARARILTVNFDDLFERAILLAGLVPRTVDAHSDVPDWAVAGAYPVVRLHGTRKVHANGGVLRSEDQPHATIDIIAKANGAGMFNAHATEVMASAVADTRLIVVGYSASDELDIVPVLPSTKPSEVVWIEHATGALRTVPNPWPSTAKEVIHGWRSAGVTVTVCRGPTLGWLARLGLPSSDTHASTVDWRGYIDGWAKRMRAKEPSGLALAGYLLSEVGDEADARACFRRSRPVAEERWTAARRTYEIGQSLYIEATTEDELAHSMRWARRSKRLADESSDEEVSLFARTLLGRIHLLRNNPRRSLAYFDEVALQPDYADPVRLWQARCLAELGERPRALQILWIAEDRAIKEGDLNGLVDIDISIAEMATDPEVAMLHLKRASRNSRVLGWTERHVAAEYETARSLYQLDRFEEAINVATEALKKDPNHAELAIGLHVLGRSEEFVGHLPSARKAYRLALRAITAVTMSIKGDVLADLAAIEFSLGHRSQGKKLLLAIDGLSNDERSSYARALAAYLSGASGEQARRLAASNSVAELERAMQRVGSK